MFLRISDKQVLKVCLVVFLVEAFYFKVFLAKSSIKSLVTMILGSTFGLKSVYIYIKGVLINFR